jgi:dolichol-phosphate mannosyltransferase
VRRRRPRLFGGEKTVTKNRVSVILPTFNEAGNITELVRAVAAAIPAGWDHEILVVDDNSPDGTYEAVRKAFGEDPRVVPILRTQDRGFAKSIRTGLERASAERVVVMDSDFTHDPAEIPRLLHVGEIYDIVSGSRFCAGGRMGDTWHYLASMLYNWMIRVVLRTQVQDNLGGFFTARRDALLKLPLDEIFFGYGDYYFRLLHFAQRARMAIVEIPAAYLPRTTGKSKSNWLRMILNYTSAAARLKLRVRQIEGRSRRTAATTVRLTQLIILAANAAIFAALAIWLRNNISLNAVLAYMEAASVGVVLAAVALNALLSLAYGFRLARLLEWPFPASLATALLGFGLNDILPFRLGEVAKIAYAHRKFAMPPALLAAASAVEKLLDVGALALLGLWAMRSVSIESVNAVTASLVSLFLAGAALLAGGLWGLHQWRRMAAVHLPWLFDAVDLLLRKGRPRTLMTIVLWTAIIWSITVSMIYVIFGAWLSAFSVSDAIILAVILALAIAIPSAPGGLGIVEAGAVGYLHEVLNVDPNQALAAALAFRFVTTLPQVLAATAIIAWNRDSSARFRAHLRGRPASTDAPKGQRAD